MESVGLYEWAGGVLESEPLSGRTALFQRAAYKGGALHEQVKGPPVFHSTEIAAVRVVHPTFYMSPLTV